MSGGDGAALHCTALHCTALHCTALHCTALHCTALQPRMRHGQLWGGEPGRLESRIHRGKDPSDPRGDLNPIGLIGIEVQASC
jgi:hypothetical protein